MKEPKINISFDLKCRELQHGVPFAYIDHPSLSLSAHITEAKAKKTFKDKLRLIIEAGLRCLKHTEHRTIGTTCGDVFHVYWDPHSDGWAYIIAGPGRRWASATLGYTKFEDAVEHARQHAKDSFGGIVWEC